jgi:WD40 repeat protein
VNTIKLILLLLILASTIVVQAQSGEVTESDQVYINAVAWSHDGSKIAAVGIRQPSTQGYLRILDAQTGETLYALDPNPGGFSSVAWSPDDRFIAAGGYDQVIWVFDVESRTHLTSLWGHQATVTAVDWNSDGTQLASSGNWDDLTILWDMKTYKKIREVIVQMPVSIAFSPNDERIAVSAEGGLRIFPSNMEVGYGREQNPFRYYDNLSIGTVAWSHDGNRIAFGTLTYRSVVNPSRRNYAQVFVVDSNSGEELQKITTEDETIYGLVWSPDDSLIATHSLEGFVRVWDVASGKELERYSGVTRYPSDLSFSPFGGRLAFGGILSMDASISIQENLDSAGLETLEGGAVKIVAPAPSIEKLQTISEQCIANPSAEAALAPQISLDQLDAFTTQVEALSSQTNPSIPPGCAADLIAVAEALQAEQ